MASAAGGDDRGCVCGEHELEDGAGSTGRQQNVVWVLGLSTA